MNSEKVFTANPSLTCNKKQKIEKSICTNFATYFAIILYNVKCKSTWMWLRTHPREGLGPSWPKFFFLLGTFWVFYSWPTFFQNLSPTPMIISPDSRLYLQKIKTHQPLLAWLIFKGSSNFYVDFYAFSSTLLHVT